MSATDKILDNLGMEKSTVEKSAETVEKYCELQDREVELQSSVEVYGTMIHRFQMVREDIDMPMGPDETTWVITDFDTECGTSETGSTTTDSSQSEDSEECTITMKVPGPWDQQTITFEEFEMGDYTPLYYYEGGRDGQDVTKTPCFGY